MQRVILLVEDNENDALRVHKAFSKTGLPLTITVVRTAEDAIAYLGTTRPHADKPENPTPAFILLDLSLPGINAFT